MPTRIKVIVIDRYPIVRWALKRYFAGHPTIEVIDEVESISQALTMIKLKPVDVAVMAISFQEGDDLEAARKLMSLVELKVVSFSNIVSWDQVESFLDAGILGVVLRYSPLEELAKAIEAAANKQRWIASDLRKTHSVKLSAANDDLFSKREREIIALIVGGLTSRQIADQLCLSLNTIESHRKRIFKKLNIRNSAQLIHYAVTKGLVNVPEGLS